MTKAGSVTPRAGIAPSADPEVGDPVTPFPTRRIFKRKIKHIVPIFIKFVGVPIDPGRKRAGLR
jgi:hypothetical protein